MSLFKYRGIPVIASVNEDGITLADLEKGGLPWLRSLTKAFPESKCILMQKDAWLYYGKKLLEPAEGVTYQ